MFFLGFVFGLWFVLRSLMVCGLGLFVCFLVVLWIDFYFVGVLVGVWILLFFSLSGFCWFLFL